MSTSTVTSEAPPKRSPFQRPGFWLVLVAIVAALAIAGFLYWQYSRQFESTDDAFIDAHVVRLAPEVGGTLIQVADVDNRHVRRGQLLAQIRPAAPEAQLAEAQAGVAQAQAQLETARAQVVAAEAQRSQAIASAQAPLAAAERARQDLARYQNLQRLDPAAIAGQQLDAARAAARQSAAEAAAAQSAIRNAAAQVAVGARNVRAAMAQIEARRAVVRQANVTLGDLRLTAPVDGHVFNRSVNLGSYVAPGTPLMSIVPDHIWVTANFKETQLTEIRPGQPVDIKVDAFPGITFKGRVDSIQRAAGQAQSILPPQNATGNFVKVVQRVPVRIEFDLKNGPDPRRYPIGPGMSVVPTVKVR
ncbi:MAG: HlyD family secretion protein [Sphingomonas sp.]|nr:HlyD family secretion protein [Sphingomonas sp.]